MENEKDEILKQRILDNLIKAQPTEKDVRKILLEKLKNGKYVGIIGIGLEKFALLLNYFDYEQNKFYEFMQKNRPMLKKSFLIYYNRQVKKILSLLNIKDFEDIREQRDKYKKEFKQNTLNKAIKETENRINNLKEVLSFFNIPTKQLKEKIKKIQIDALDENELNENYLKDLYVLRELFLAKAKGELVTTMTEAIWEVEHNTKGEIVKKQIYMNRNEKQLMTIKTQSHLPDEKSLVALRLIDDMILQLQNNSSIEVTEDDLLEMYRQIREKAIKEKEKYLTSK